VSVDGEECLLDIFDTGNGSMFPKRSAGQEDFSAVRDQYMRSGDGFLCVYSVTYAQSFAEVENLHKHSLKVKDVENIPFVLAGNKVDLEDSREVSPAQVLT
jgi:GTPase KRas protein